MRNIIYDIETFAPNECDVKDDKGKYKPFPLKEKIIIISVLNLDNNEIKSFYGKDEQIVLECFWNYIKEDDTLWGFNNACFDDRYLEIRSFVNNVKIKHFFSRDLRIVFSKGDIYQKGKLSDYAEAIGFKAQTENGSLMRGFYTREEWDKIKAHCEEDCLLSSKIYERCKGCNLI